MVKIKLYVALILIRVIAKSFIYKLNEIPAKNKDNLNNNVTHLFNVNLHIPINSLQIPVNT